MRSAGATGAACSSTWSESRESARRRSCSSKSGLRTRWGGASIPATASSRSAFGAATIRRVEAARTRWFSRSICDSIHECAERALPGRDGARSRVEAARERAPSLPGSARSAHSWIESQIERENQRVLAASTRRIVAAPNADLLEAVAGIEAPPHLVRRPDFEEQDLRLALSRDSDHVLEQAAPVAPALRMGGNAQVQEMGFARGKQEHRVTDQL